MAACLRSAVGFYNGGGGVTPTPTPTPTTDKATYRTLQWNGSTVKALCDVYGRLFTRYDSANDVYNGVAWTDEGLDKTFDSIDEHADAFLTLIRTYGHNDAVTGEGVDNVVINLDGTSTEFTFTDGQLVPVSSAWVNGAVPTLFKRSLNDGTADVVVVCDADGKLVLNTNGEGYYIYNNEYDAINPRSNNQSELVAAAGGSVLADTFGDNDGNYYLINLDGYTVCANDDGVVTVGDITEWPVSTLVRSIQVPFGGGNVNIPVDKYGRVMVKHVADGDVNYTPWWVDGNQIAVFDDAADQVLVDAMRDHGYVDCLSFTQVSDITVTIDGQSEHLVFSSESKKFNMFVPGWLNAEANLLYCSFALSGGTVISAVMDAASGGLAIVRNDGNDYFLKVVFSGSEVQALELALVSDYPGISEVTVSTKLLGFFESSVPDQGDTDVLANTVDGDIFVVVLNQDGEYREGSARVPAAPLEEGLYIMATGGNCYLVNEERKIVYVNIQDSSYSTAQYFKSNGLNDTMYLNSSPASQSIVEEFGVLENVEAFEEGSNIFISYKGKGYSYYTYNNKFDNTVKYA